MDRSSLYSVNVTLIIQYIGFIFITSYRHTSHCAIQGR